MPVDVNAQTIQFFACTLSGGAIGVLYNLFAAIRRGFSFGRVATFFVDLIFWIAGTVVFFCILHTERAQNALRTRNCYKIDKFSAKVLYI